MTPIIEQAEANLRKLLGIPNNYRVLFLQGGALLQFGMVPMNFLRNSGKPADYVVTGTWAEKAMDEAKTQGDVRAAWNGKTDQLQAGAPAGRTELDPEAAYVYSAPTRPSRASVSRASPSLGGVPLVCDASCDFLCRPVPIEQFGILFACARRTPARRA